MRIQIITPATAGSRHGNRVTAERWAAILTDLGHETAIAEEFIGQPADCSIALHAVKSAVALREFRAQHATSPILVAITGTDIYGTEADRLASYATLRTADRIIALQPATAADLPSEFADKVRVIFQSASPPVRTLPPLEDYFEVCVSGHLRPVKDPFRTAEAVRLLPPDSRVFVTHIGRALTPEMADRATREMVTNDRYRWLGDLPHEEALSIVSRTRLLAVTSLSEGGPAVIAEALVTGIPVIASRVAGCIGMLGDDYPGYFLADSTAALADLLRRAEMDQSFFATLKKAAKLRSELFAPERERAAWKSLLAEL